MTFEEIVEIEWLVILVPGAVRSIFLLAHLHGVVRALASNGAGLTYAKGARVQETVRLSGLVGLISAVPVEHFFPDRGGVFALLVAASTLTANTFLAGRLTDRLEAEDPSAESKPARLRRFLTFERKRREAYDASEAVEREAFEEDEAIDQGKGEG